MELQRHHPLPEIIINYEEDGGEMQPTSGERIGSFFEEIYSNYNKLWQEIIKVPNINGDYVSCESFIRVLYCSNVQIHDPYCLFLLDTCAMKIQSAGSGSQGSHKSLTRLSNDFERQVDFKLFLNTAIKEKIHSFERPFNDESFIVDHFWRAKFPHTSQSSAKLNRSHSAQIQKLGVSLNPSPTAGVNAKHLKVPIETFNQAFYQFFHRDVKLI